MSDEKLTRLSRTRTFDGWLETYTHQSSSCRRPMTFSLFMPPQASAGKVPVLYWLSGLTCNHENFVHKAGALEHAAKLGIAVVAPDTSPRDNGIDGEDDSYDLGTGAGFYVNATRSPWSKNYRMFDYITWELPDILDSDFRLDGERRSIFGHSMGGHGALVVSLKNPGMFRSVSAFSPICSPTRCPWGEKIFSAYLGDDRAAWDAYDAALLIEAGAASLPILIDQGEDDDFLAEQLKPELLEAACKKAGVALDLRMRKGYDHSYYFIATFIGEHMRYHADHLLG
ncbi:MAG: S-formylglutathione hydrolase [Rhodospirillales bacterium]|nr:S-formylglutathione hydrolase [Rhodospirillales bacterium]